MTDLSLRDLIVKRLAVKMRINETDVDAVITHQFKGITKALKTENSVEIAGFGKFVFSTRRAERTLAILKKQLEEHLTEGKPLTKNRTLESMQYDIESIEKRLYGDKTNTDTGGSN